MVTKLWCLIRHACLGLIMVLLCSHSLHAQTTASDMVKAYRAYRPMHPFNALAMNLSEEQDAQVRNQVSNIVEAAKATSGQSPVGMELVNFTVAARAWFVSHVVSSATPSAVDYAARIRAIDSATLDEWSAAVSPLDLGPKDRILLVLTIAFNDPLWSGVKWRPGNPKAAIARLKSLSKDAVSTWADATGDKEAPFLPAYSLLAVNSLFPSDAFSPTGFQAALPAAKRLLSEAK